MTDKRKSQTFHQITSEQDIEVILNNHNVTLKERHDGLTVILPNEIEENKKRNLVPVSDILTNNEDSIAETSEDEDYYETYENVSNQKLIEKEIYFQNQINELTKKNQQLKNAIENLQQEKYNKINYNDFKYNVLTILEDKKIRELRKEIFNLKQILNNVKKNNKEMFKEIQKNNSDLKIKYKELSKIKTELFKVELEIKTKENFDNYLLSKEYLLKDNIKNIEEEISKIAEKHRILIKENQKNNIEIKKFEFDIENRTKKLDKYIKNLSIPSTPPALWIKKSDELAKLHKEAERVTTEKEFIKIRKKIEKIDKVMMKIWDGKKIEKIYEEILPIEDKIIFITTFIHMDNSITEKILYFDYYKNNDDLQIVNQIKNYENINEYKKDITLIEDISIIKDNLFFSKMSIKNFLNKQEESNWKIPKAEWIIFISLSLLSITLLAIPVAVPALVPIISTILWEKTLVSIVGIGIAWIVNKGIWTIATEKTKKVEVWMKQKFYSLIRKIPFVNKRNLGKTKEELEIKKNVEKTIENLTSDKLETKFQTQYDILKQELNFNKNKNINELINNKEIKFKSKIDNQENSNAQFENNQNFNEQSINNMELNLENQPSTSTGIYNSL